MSEKRYNIVDLQLHEYYEENITLEEAKECAVRFAEQSIRESGSDSLRENSQMLAEILKDTTPEEVAESLLLFDFDLERA